MKKITKNATIIGIGFAGLIQIAIIILKIRKAISWGWFDLFFPTIFTVFLVLVIAILKIIKNEF